MCVTYQKFDYVLNGDSSTDVEGDWIDCCGVDEISFLGILSSNVNAASCKIEGTNDATFVSAVFTLATLSSVGNIGASIQLSAGVSSPLPRWVRLKYFHGTGGGANGLNVSAVGRS